MIDWDESEKTIGLQYLADAIDRHALKLGIPEHEALLHLAQQWEAGTEIRLE